MQPSWSRFTVSLVALILVTANTGRASEIHYSWKSTITPGSIPADQATGSSLGLVGLGDASKFVSNSSWNDWRTVGATYLMAGSNNATYTNQSFALTLKLTDGPSGLSDVLTFHGMVNGGGSNWLNATFSDGNCSVPIGQDIYHIHMLDGPLNNGLGSAPYADIFATIDVSTASATPEPSSLMLSALALSVLGFARGKKPAAGYRHRPDISAIFGNLLG